MSLAVSKGINKNRYHILHVIIIIIDLFCIVYSIIPFTVGYLTIFPVLDMGYFQRKGI